jgi:LemA protein
MDWIVIAILGAIAFWFFVTYNKFVRFIEAVENSNKEISVQLDRRGKVFDSLISAVKKFMDHESSVLVKVTELRSKIANNNVSKGEKQAAENELSKVVASGELNSALSITMESYPELKSDQNMLQLQEEIVSTENKLMFSKKAYNNAVEEYNVAKKSLPDLLIPSMVSSLNKVFEYWSLSDEQVEIEEQRRVEF